MLDGTQFAESQTTHRIVPALQSRVPGTHAELMARILGWERNLVHELKNDRH
jgi:hypothetical protein